MIYTAETLNNQVELYASKDRVSETAELLVLYININPSKTQHDIFMQIIMYLHIYKKIIFSYTYTIHIQIFNRPL